MARFEERLISAASYWGSTGGRSDEEGWAEEFEEVEAERSPALAEALLDRIARIRGDGRGGLAPSRKAPGGGDIQGRLLLYRLARSLATGEAEVASRGFFDVSDRPPGMLWLEALSRPLSRQPGSFEIAMLAFVPEPCVVRAAAGRRACVNGSLLFLDELGGDLAMQLNRVLGDRIG